MPFFSFLQFLFQKYNNFSVIPHMRASFQKKRGKILTKRQQIISSDLSQSKSSIRQPEIPLKMTSKDTSIRRALEQAQAMLVQQRQAREDLQRKVNRLQMRGIDREKQFRRIIQETIPFCIKQQSNAVINADLKVLHQKLMAFFEATQQQVQRSLNEEKRSLEDQMERRIQEVTRHAEQQISQHKRLQSLNYQKIHREISTALANCTAILTENEQMKRRIRELTFNNVILREERGLLIEEVLQKKNLILRMYGQLREKYSRDDEIEKEVAVLRRERQRVDQMYANYQENQRKDADSCFKTIENIRPKAVHLFATDPANPPPTKNTLPYRTFTQSKEKATPVRFSSTADVKNRSNPKASLHRTIATCSSEKEQEWSVSQLRESLRRERRKNLLQAQKIDYLVGYKRDIDLFVRECYRRGDLQGIDLDKVVRLLAGLKKVVEKDPTIQTQRLAPVAGGNEGYELLLEDY